MAGRVDGQGTRGAAVAGRVDGHGTVAAAYVEQRVDPLGEGRERLLTGGESKPTMARESHLRPERHRLLKAPRHGPVIAIPDVLHVLDAEARPAAKLARIDRSISVTAVRISVDVLGLETHL